jgi:hypothetical protein
MVLPTTKAATWLSITLIDKGFWMTKGGDVRGSSFATFGNNLEVVLDSLRRVSCNPGVLQVDKP